MFIDTAINTASIYYKSGQLDQALSTLNSLGNLEYDPEKKKSFYNLYYRYGCIYLKKEDGMDKAKEYFSKCIDVDPNNNKAYLRLMTYYQKIGDKAEGLRVAEKAKKIDENDNEYLRYRASMELRFDNYEEALKLYERIINQNRKPEEVHYALFNKIVCLYQLGQEEEARSLLEKLDDEVTNHEESLRRSICRVQLDFLRSDQKYDEAKKRIKQVDREGLFKNHFYELQTYKLQIDCDAKNWDDAINDGQSVIKAIEGGHFNSITENGWEMLFYVALAYRGKGEMQKYKEYMKLIKESKKLTTEEYYLELAKSHFANNEIESTYLMLNKIFQKDKKYVPAIKFRFAVLNSEGKVEEANKLFNDNKKYIERYDRDFYALKMNYGVDIDTVTQTVFNDMDISVALGETELISGKPLPDSKRIIPSASTKSSQLSKDANLGIQLPKEILKELGRGGMGIVTLEKIDGEECACKRLNPELIGDTEAVETMAKEIKTEAQKMIFLEHPNVILLKGFFMTKLMMEYAKGGDLFKLLNNYPDLSLKYKIYLCLGIAKGLQYIHGNEIVHGDMKPQNILLDREYNPNIPNEFPCPKICDFGISKVLTKGALKAGIHGYTLIYTAPEVLNEGLISKESDVFSYGLIMYKIFTKKNPYEEIEKEKKFAYIKQGNLPQFENELKAEICPEEIKNIIINCCQIFPFDRIKLDRVIEKLNILYEEE